MTRLTAIIIQGDDNVSGSSYGPVDGKFGLYVGTVDHSPSGCERPRPLLTSEPIYSTAEEARKAAENVIAETRSNPAKSRPPKGGGFDREDGK